MDPLSWHEGFHSNGHKSHAPSPSHAFLWAQKESICTAEGLRTWRLRCPLATEGCQGSRWRERPVPPGASGRSRGRVLRPDAPRRLLTASGRPNRRANVARSLSSTEGGSVS